MNGGEAATAEASVVTGGAPPRLASGELLDLQAVETDRFLGFSSHSPHPARIFGGQVVAQALAAAYRSIDGRPCHSLHGYFIRAGDPSRPILYEVERTRDGRSFSTRRVVAIQGGRQIFNLSASFQALEVGLEHQTAAPVTPGPEGFLAEEELFAAAKDASSSPSPIELRPVNPLGRGDTRPDDLGFRCWIRARIPVGDDPADNQCFLAYASDMWLVDTSARPHSGEYAPGSGLGWASLDHAVWFHRPCRINDWHLYVQDSPNASGGRGFARGAVYDSTGRLVASVAQETLIRIG